MSNISIDLVRQCLRGEHSAMTSLMQKLHPLVFGVCFKMLGHRHDAEDAVQETFVRVFRHLGHWDQQRPFEPWLLTIAGNRCRTMLARRKKIPNTDTQGFLESSVTAQEDHSQHLREELDLALSTLRDEHREAFLMFHRDQLCYQDIADRLEVPLGTVKTWVHRARIHIIRELQNRDALETYRHAVS
jgi:RNA polymerase sigma-70 factor (ECF subfamily)